MRARRHTGGRTSALDVEDDGRNLGVVREPDELLHQRDAGSRCIRERARARPACTDGDARGGELVLRLKNAVPRAPGAGLGAKLAAEHRERFHQRRRRCDGIPCTHCRAREDRAERSGGVAVDDDGVAGGVHPLEMEGQWAVVVSPRVVVAQSDRGIVGVEQPWLLRELLHQHPTDEVDVEVQQRGERAGVHDIAQQRAVAVALEVLDAELPERNAEYRVAFTHELWLEGPRRVVEQIAAGPHRRDVSRVCGRIQRNDEIHLVRPRGVAVLADANLVDRRQSLNVRRKEILPSDGDAHAKDGPHQQAVGTRRTRAIHRRHLEREVVDAAHALTATGASIADAYGITSANFAMSHAAVGQRSAHSPQCRQMSSSFTITRFVCGRVSDT